MTFNTEPSPSAIYQISQNMKIYRITNELLLNDDKLWLKRDTNALFHPQADSKATAL